MANAIIGAFHLIPRRMSGLALAEFMIPFFIILIAFTSTKLCQLLLLETLTLRLNVPQQQQTQIITIIVEEPLING